MTGGGGTTTTVNKTELPQWVNDAAQSNYQQATQVASEHPTLPTSYAAPQSDMTNQALSYFQNNLGAGTPNITAAGQTYNTLADPTALGANIQALENPYTDDVVNKSIADLMDTNKQTLMGNDASATAAGAFGGTRGAVVDGVTNAQTVKNAGLLSSTLRQQGYDTAASNAISALGTAGAGQLATGTAQNNNVLSNYSGLLTGGQTEQTNDQAQLDSQNKTLSAQQQQDLANLNIKLAALGMSPYPTTTTQTGTSTTSPDLATSGLGILSLLSSFIP